MKIYGFCFLMIVQSFVLFGKQDLPADITLGIVDLKFDGSHIKICEMGDGLISGFNGYYKCHDQNFLWDKIASSFNKFNLPIYFFFLQKFKSAATIYQSFRRNGAIMLDTIHDYQRLFEILCKAYKKDNNNDIQSYRGIIIPKGRPNYKTPIYFPDQSSFCENNMIIVGKYSHYFFMDKNLVDTLLFKNDKNLLRFRPQSGVYTKKYSSGLTRKILNDISSDILVIKPYHGGHGDGIIFTPRESLDNVLKSILTYEDVSVKENIVNASLKNYWKNNKNDIFLVEEFVSSKPIMVNEKPYDATLRMIFLASCSQQEIKIDIIDGYWKLPVKSLNEKGSFLDLHKSCISAHKLSSALLDKHDFSLVSQELLQCLPLVYKNMLTAVAKTI